MSLKTKYKQLKKQWGALRLKWSKSLLDRMPTASPALNPQSIKGIVFLRQDGKIGDYIVSAFAFREIKRLQPNIHIGVICSDKNRQMFDENPYIDALHVVKAKSTFSYHQVGRSVAGQYDVAIEPTLVLRPRDLILLRALNCRYNIGLDKQDYRIFNLNIANTQQHFSDVYAQALNLCGFENIDTKAELPANAQSAAAVQAFLAENHLTDFVALNFFGAANFRRFDETHIRAILQQLFKDFPEQKFVLLTYPEVTPMLQKMADEFAHVFVFANTVSIQDSIELIRHANVVLTPDTAIIHIAAALNKNIVGLYQDNPQNLANWYPKCDNTELIFFKQHIQEITPQQISAILSQF